MRQLASGIRWSLKYRNTGVTSSLAVEWKSEVGSTATLLRY